MTPNEDFQEIHIELIDPNPSQPRTNFDEARLDELAQSIRSNGIVQPLMVRRHGMRFQLVAGERRWRAAQRAGLERVPAVVREIPDDRLLELALIENIQRKELNAIEEANAYKNLIEGHGLTQESLAQRVGRDRSFITNYLRLLRLPAEIQSLLADEKLTTGHARTLLGIEGTQIQLRVAQEIVKQSLSVRETEKAIKKIIAGSSPAAATSRAPKQVDANVRLAETKLRRRFGTQVRIRPSQSGDGGKIELEYYNDRDLDRLYNLLLDSQEAAAAG